MQIKCLIKNYLNDHLILDQYDAVREEREKYGDDAHESPEFQVGHFWKVHTSDIVCKIGTWKGNYLLKY